ncbi:MAG: secondary thiamine-phosphate synthase enzyme YjbQ [Xanthobacteraceae bacterium]|nr:secondary thiamine-phosphate synthase enzyme YjbQ [Xanthobacteraceae bacterium]QYK44961.1 MAG: secondary thiamine-phosphate synthase enzyme YjbQ [Xanthobacteraceae bacterium]
MRQAAGSLRIETKGRGLIEFTREVAAWLAQEKFQTALLTVYCRHTSASLLIQENADPDVQTDLQNYFAEIAPESERYIHSAEGPDDMPAHLRAALTQTSLSIPVTGGRMALGTWQGIYLFEHRARPHTREIVLHAIGD